MTNPQEILKRFNNIYKKEDLIYHRAAKECGLSDATYWILYALSGEDEPLTQKELFDMLYFPKQTTNSALKKLEDQGLISFNPGKDKRSKYISLTDKGISLSKETVDKAIAAELASFSTFSEEDAEILLSLYERYTDTLEKNMQSITSRKDNHD